MPRAADFFKSLVPVIYVPPNPKSEYVLRKLAYSLSMREVSQRCPVTNEGGVRSHQTGQESKKCVSAPNASHDHPDGVDESSETRLSRDAADTTDGDERR